jgi:hypothetical protein
MNYGTRHPKFFLPVFSQLFSSSQMVVSSQRVVMERCSRATLAAWSRCHGKQAYDDSIAEGGEGVQAHVAPAHACSSFCSGKIEPANRTMAASSPRIPATAGTEFTVAQVQRLARRIRARDFIGKVAKASTTSSEASTRPAAWRARGRGSPVPAGDPTLPWANACRSRPRQCAIAPCRHPRGRRVWSGRGGDAWSNLDMALGT